MLPIPRSLLIHSAVLITESSENKWGAPAESESVTLNNVRIEYSEKMITDRNGETVKLSAVLFFDMKNSSPKNVEFALAGDTIGGKTAAVQHLKFDGKTFTVRNIEPLFSSGTEIHHYEIGLV